MGFPSYLPRTVTLHPPLHFSVRHSNRLAIQFTQMLVLRGRAASTAVGRTEEASSHSQHPRDFLPWRQCRHSDSVVVLNITSLNVKGKAVPVLN
jgi:hypothetical protein